MADERGQGLGGLAFALAWVRDPRRVGAIAPASRALAQAIAREVARVGPELLLEIGAGTGQHAVYFTTHLPHLQWQPTDCEANLAGIGLWVSEAALPNLRAPLRLDVRDSTWPVEMADYVFSANTSHIMS